MFYVCSQAGIRQEQEKNQYVSKLNELIDKTMKNECNSKIVIDAMLHWCTHSVMCCVGKLM